MVYLAQVTVYTALMCIVYWLFLRNRPMHGISRGYLLLSAGLPPLLPFISLPQWQQKMQPVTVTALQLPEFAVGTAAVGQGGGAANWLLMGYITISLALLAVMIRNFYRLASVIGRSKTQREQGYTLVKESGYGPGSWYKYIFLPNAEENEMIIRHERAHVRLYHSIDVMFLHLLQIVFWPNLMLLWLRKELMQVHEFQADAVSSGDKTAYADLLVANLFGRCTLPVSHSFIVHPIKRRIMMLKKRGGRFPQVVSMLAAALVAGFVLVNIVAMQSCESKEMIVEEKQTEPLLYADQMPEFPGGMEAMNGFLADKLVYPAEARAKKIEGKVIVSFTVQADGSVTDAKVKNKADPILAEAALDIINQMPKWTPGEHNGKKVAVAFTLPVQFKLDNEQAK